MLVTCCYFWVETPPEIAKLAILAKLSKTRIANIFSCVEG